MDLSILQQKFLNKTIKIISLDDYYAADEYAGRTGKVTFIDDIGQLHGTWGGIAVIPEKDIIEIIENDNDTPENITLSLSDFEIDWNEDVMIEENVANYVLVAIKDEPIDAVDMMRIKNGHTDIAASSENDVYYNFYLNINLKTGEKTIEVTVNHSENDDWHEYSFKCSISSPKLEQLLLKTLLIITNDD